MTSAADVGANLATAERLLRTARAGGAVLAVLPENFAFMGARDRDKLAIAEDALSDEAQAAVVAKAESGDAAQRRPSSSSKGGSAGGPAEAGEWARSPTPIQSFLSRQARELGLWIVAGTVPLRVPHETSRVAAACLVYDDAGRRVARYDKIHLFDVDVPAAALPAGVAAENASSDPARSSKSAGDCREASRSVESYRESATMAPGDTPVVVQTPVGKLGLSVCYDIRFPELFRTLVAQGAELFSVPAAFTVPTGEAHWEALLRARAVENLAYVVAAAQWGRHASGRHTYGHSLVVEPWGQVVRSQASGEGVVLAEIDLNSQSELRRRFPALTHRRLG